MKLELDPSDRYIQIIWDIEFLGGVGRDISQQTHRAKHPSP